MISTVESYYISTYITLFDPPDDYISYLILSMSINGDFIIRYYIGRAEKSIVHILHNPNDLPEAPNRETVKEWVIKSISEYLG